MNEFPGPGTTAVLLAAGAGMRLGLGLGAKALLPFRGRTLVEVLADVLRDGGCREVAVVLGAEAERVLERTDLGRHTVVVNPQWRDGMGGSFRLGVGAARTSTPRTSWGCWADRGQPITCCLLRIPKGRASRALPPRSKVKHGNDRRRRPAALPGTTAR